MNNPLVALLLEAQKIILPAARGDANKAIAIRRLADLLCTPAVHVHLVDAGAFEHLKFRSAPAAA